MLVKWVRCSVEPDGQRAFSVAQAGWDRLAGEPGLVGQIGGWDVRSPELACVIGLWHDRSSYGDFMAARHDDLVAALGQTGTYSSIDIAVGEVLTNIGDGGALREGGVLRIADCLVRSERVDHFVTVQEQVWIPGMTAAPGMLGGWFSQLASNRFLVTTLWRDLDSHAAYVADRLPDLRAQAQVDDDVLDLAGHVAALEPSWHVLGAAVS